MTTQALGRNFVKPGLCAGVGAIMASAEGLGSFTLSGSIPVIGGRVLTPVQYGALVGTLSCFFVESINNIVVGVTSDQRLKTAESFVAHTVGASVAWAAMPYLLGDGGTSQTYSHKLMRIGFLSELLSQWVYENFIEDGSFGQDVLDLV